MTDSLDNDFILLVTEPTLMRCVVPRIPPTDIFSRYPTQLLDHYRRYNQEKMPLALLFLPLIYYIDVLIPSHIEPIRYFPYLYIARIYIKLFNF